MSRKWEVGNEPTPADFVADPSRGPGCPGREGFEPPTSHFKPPASDPEHHFTQVHRPG